MNCKPRAYEIVSCLLVFISLFSSFNLGGAEETSFNGHGFLWHQLKPNENVDRNPIKLSLWFKTKHSSGLLVAANYRGDGAMFAVTMKDGKLRCILPSSDPNSTWRHVEIDNLTVSDGRWHLASIVQHEGALTCEVDGFNKTLTDIDTGMNGLMFIGGVPRTQGLGKYPSCLSTVKNFIGCLGEVFLRNEYLDDIIRRRYIRLKKRPACDPGKSGLISLQDPKSELIWMMTNTTSTVTSIDFQINTQLKDGFILKVSLKHFVLSLFLMDGRIKAKLKLNTGPHFKVTQVISSSKLGVSDGRWHRVTCYVTMKNKEFTLSIDGETQFRKQFLNIPAKSQETGSTGLFRLGGDFHKYQPFVGCVREVFINKVWIQPTDQPSIIKSTNIIMGSCSRVDRTDNAVVPVPSMTNRTDGILKGGELTNKNLHRTTKVHSNTTTTNMFTMLPYFNGKPFYALYKSRRNNLKSNVTGLSKGTNTDSISFPYLVPIVIIVGVFLFLLFCVLGVCAGTKRYLCFKDRSKRPIEGYICTNSASKRIQTNVGDNRVDLSKNVDGLYGTTGSLHSLKKQQAEYWMERDAKLLDYPCRQSIHHSSVTKQDYARRNLPPLTHFEATQSSSNKRQRTIAAPEVQDKRDTSKTPVESTNLLISSKESRGTTDKISCETNFKPTHRSSIKVRKPKGPDKLLVKNKKRLGYGWAYGSRFARGADSSDTDCSDIERISSHSRYSGKRSGTSHVKRPLRILQASETEDESNDEKCRDGQNKKRSRFGRKKKFDTFWGQGTRVLNVLPEEEKKQDMMVLQGDEKSAGDALLTSGPGRHQGSHLPIKAGLKHGGMSDKRRGRDQNDKGDGSHEGSLETSAYLKRGDPDGRPEIPRRLCALKFPDDAHHKPRSSQDTSKSSNLKDEQVLGPYYNITSPHRKHLTGLQDVGTRAAVQLNQENVGCVTFKANAQQTTIIGGKRYKSKPCVAGPHMSRIPKETFIPRTNNAMAGDIPTMI